MTAENSFHNHLEDCERCRKEIFNLCPKGIRLLSLAASEPFSDPKLTGLAHWNRVLGQKDAD